MKHAVLHWIMATGYAMLASVHIAAAQQEFHLDDYRDFLERNAEITTDELLAGYPAGRFVESLGLSFPAADYADSIDIKYQLTSYERSLLEKHGFVVTERLSYSSMGEALLDIYHKDLPAFVSSDAILHALHRSYVSMLQQVEGGQLAQFVGVLLKAAHEYIPVLSQRYAGYERMRQSIDDLDVFLTVPRTLLETEPVTPQFERNASEVQKVLGMIEGQEAIWYPLFGDCPRHIDFSQFTPRGHYASSGSLTRYFRAMIWLGRTELYLRPPQAYAACPQERQEADVQRQTLLAALLAEAVAQSNVLREYENVDNILQSFVGPSDNVTLPQLLDVMRDAGLRDAADLLDAGNLAHFQDALMRRPFANQAILSQILYSDPMSPTSIEPASAFLLLGQRFVIDSYILANVVFDQIIHRRKKIKRMIPSTLDALFALGNNATVQLLLPELERYPYGRNLAGLRYLIDAHEGEYWSSSIYAGWLGALRKLNPPQSRAGLPPFMQTAAWWQEKMNTQLASWAQLRHDNLLYAKPSYTGGATCSFPKSYVEPIPEFYTCLERFALHTAERFTDNNLPVYFADFWKEFGATMQQLATIAEKQLQGAALDEKERAFLAAMLYEAPGCTIEYDGWYADLFWGGKSDLLLDDKIVADVHTIPTDANGNLVGWVLHAGTGPINMAVVLAEDDRGKPTAYIGPVLSYYEHTSLNFKRLTDDEWAEQYNQAPSLRPQWTDVYLAGPDGGPRAEHAAPTLLTGAEIETGERRQPDVNALGAGVQLRPLYPNPASESTLIGFTVHESAAGPVDVRILNAQGRLMHTLFSGIIPAGAYTLRWDLRLANGAEAAEGAYFIEVRAQGAVASGNVVVFR